MIEALPQQLKLRILRLSDITGSKDISYSSLERKGIEAEPAEQAILLIAYQSIHLTWRSCQHYRYAGLFHF